MTRSYLDQWFLTECTVLSDFFLYQYFNFWYYRPLLYYGKKFQNIEKKIRTNSEEYNNTENHENFKNNKPRVQLYWFSFKKVYFRKYRKKTVPWNGLKIFLTNMSIECRYSCFFHNRACFLTVNLHLLFQCTQEV